MFDDLEQEIGVGRLEAPRGNQIEPPDCAVAEAEGRADKSAAVQQGEQRFAGRLTRFGVLLLVQIVSVKAGADLPPAARLAVINSDDFVWQREQLLGQFGV